MRPLDVVYLVAVLVALLTAGWIAAPAAAVVSGGVAARTALRHRRTG